MVNLNSCAKLPAGKPPSQNHPTKIRHQNISKPSNYLRLNYADCQLLLASVGPDNGFRGCSLADNRVECPGNTTAPAPMGPSARTWL